MNILKNTESALQYRRGIASAIKAYSLSPTTSVRYFGLTKMGTRLVNSSVRIIKVHLRQHPCVNRVAGKKHLDNSANITLYQLDQKRRSKSKTLMSSTSHRTYHWISPRKRIKRTGLFSAGSWKSWIAIGTKSPFFLQWNKAKGAQIYNTAKKRTNAALKPKLLHVIFKTILNDLDGRLKRWLLGKGTGAWQ